MKNELSGGYLRDYSEIEKYLKNHVEKGEKLEDTLEDLYMMYSDLEAEGADISFAHEGTAEEYAKELAEQLPKKKVFFTKKRVIFFLIALVLVSGIYFYSNSPVRRMTGGLDYVVNHLDDYTFDETGTTEYSITILDGGTVINSDLLEITDWNLFGDGEIFIEGTTYSSYKDANHGEIFIPTVYPSTFRDNPKNFIEKISNYSEDSIRIIGNTNTGCGINLHHRGTYGYEILYRGKPVYYKINPDGSVDFKFVFEKTDSPYNEKSISEIAENCHDSDDDDYRIYLILKCLAVKWEYNESVFSESK